MTISLTGVRRTLTASLVAGSFLAAPAVQALDIKSSDIHPMGYPTTDAIQYMG